MAEPEPPTDPNDVQSIPIPQWWRIPKPSARRAPLTREAIIEAALRVLDQEGLNRVSMRRVAEELGTGAGSLYWHVGNKEELLELVVDRVSSELDLPQPEPSRWQEQLKDVAREMRHLMKRHRDVARISLGRIPVGPNLVRVVEWMLVLLRGAGVPDRTAALAGDLLALYVGAYAYEESLPFNPPGDAPPEQIGRMIRDYFVSLPPDRFPNTVALADELIAGGPDERFEFGLEVIVRGLAAEAAVARSHR